MSDPFRHEREILLDRSKRSIKVILQTPDEKLPARAESLSRDLGATFLRYLRQPESIPRAVLLDFTGAGPTDSMPIPLEAVSSTGGPELIEFLQPRYALADYVCDDGFQRILADALYYAAHYREIRERMAARSVTRSCLLNFFGVSGTGKTMAAEAFASSLGRRLAVLNYANVESSLLGKTTKNITEAFRGIDPSGDVILLDEADAFVSRRIVEVRQGAEYALNMARAQIIQEVDRFTGVIIMATNLYGSYDSAILRRIKFNVFFEPPSLSVIAELYRRFLPPDLHPAAGELGELAAKSSGLTGGEIYNLCEIFVMRALRNQEEGRPAPGIVDLNELAAATQSGRSDRIRSVGDSTAPTARPA